jgi:hypothetical protein
VRFGKAFPVVLVVDWDALDSLIEEITAGRDIETKKGGKG